MKKLFVIICLLISSLLTYSQQIDTVIVNKEYSSYFSYEVENPLFVVYKLYKGGGDASRKGMYFKTDNLPNSLTLKDYSKSGYDIGHLASAKDFAHNTKEEELTFRFYNSVPQTPALNRGIWREYEGHIRTLSQTDSLLIICGGYEYKKINDLYVPSYCFKVVKNLVDKSIHCYEFKNDDSEEVRTISIDQLYNDTNYSPWLEEWLK